MRPSAARLGLTVEIIALQKQPGFDNEQVVAIDPPAGTLAPLTRLVRVTVRGVTREVAFDADLLTTRNLGRRPATTRDARKSPAARDAGRPDLSRLTWTSSSAVTAGRGTGGRTRCSSAESVFANSLLHAL